MSLCKKIGNYFSPTPAASARSPSPPTRGARLGSSYRMGGSYRWAVISTGSRRFEFSLLVLTVVAIVLLNSRGLHCHPDAAPGDVVLEEPFAEPILFEDQVADAFTDQKYLTDKASKSVLDLLPDAAGGELAKVCSWADQVRFRYRWASPLHYINTPGVCNFAYSRDCHNSNGERNMCVAGAINNYTAQLQSSNDLSNGYNLTESLMFLAHFVGDIHQPLHVSFEADEGGNTISVRWYRKKSNLHHVWDVNIIETAMKDFYNNDLNAMVESIQMNITSYEISHWTCNRNSAACTNKYASESISLACDHAYKDVDQGSTLGDDYFFSRLPIVKERIAQGGVRLASILNEIFDSSSRGRALKLPSGGRDDGRGIEFS